MIAAMWRKKKVRSSVRMCEPSTSASVMITILWYRIFSASKSVEIPAPSAVIRVRISAEGEHLVQPGLLDVQDLAAQRQDGLGAAVAAHLGAAAGRVALDDENLRERGILLLAVRELSGQGAGVEGALAPDELACLARGLARSRRLDVSSRRSSCRHGWFLQEGTELVVDDLLHPGLDLGGDELVLGLRGELRVSHLDRDDGGQAFAAVVAGEDWSP